MSILPVFSFFFFFLFFLQKYPLSPNSLTNILPMKSNYGLLHFPCNIPRSATMLLKNHRPVSERLVCRSSFDPVCSRLKKDYQSEKRSSVILLFAAFHHGGKRNNREALAACSVGRLIVAAAKNHVPL